MMLQHLKRTLDGESLTAVANHPDVRPWLGGEGDIDLRAAVANPLNVALVNEHGGFVAIRHEPAIYEVHTLFRKEGRGAHLIEAAAESFRYMFAATDCIEIQTKVPAGNVAAHRLAQIVGFQPVFEREKAWIGPDGGLASISYRSLSFDAWRAKDNSIERAGNWFRKSLSEGANAEVAADPAHDRAVGAAVLMVQAGNARKAVWLYNRWARHAGLAPMTMLSEAPVVLEMTAGTSVLAVEARGTAMEVLSCQSPSH